MNKFFASVLLLLLAVSTAFAQATAFGGGLDPSTPAAPAVYCAGNSDRILVGAVSLVDANNANVWQICHTKSSTPPATIVLPDVAAVQTILAAADGSFYVVSPDMVWKSTDYGVMSWRVPRGGYPIQADPMIFNAYDRVYYNTLGIRVNFPMGSPIPGSKSYNYGLYSDDWFSSARFSDDPSSICSQIVATKENYCLDANTKVVFQPTVRNNPFGYQEPDYSVGNEYFAGRNPVAEAGGADGNLYVLLGNISGKSGAAPFTGALAMLETTRTGKVVERVLIPNLDVIPDMHIQALGAGAFGVYYITGSGKEATLWKYEYGTGAVTRFGSAPQGFALSGLTVAPSGYNGGGKGLSTEP